MKIVSRLLTATLVVAVAGCSAATTINGSPAGGKTSHSAGSTASVNTCERLHGLNSPSERTKTNRNGLIHFVFKSCSTNGVGATSDGYVQIDDYETGTGAGDDADDTDVYNFITGPCTGYRITYGYIGLKKTFPAVNLHQGTITQIDHPTQPYTFNTRKFHIATPGQGQAVLVDNGDADFKTLICQGATTTAASVPKALTHPPALPTSPPTTGSNNPGGLTPPVGYTTARTFTASASGTSARFVLDPSSQSAFTWRCVNGQVQQFGITMSPAGHESSYSDPGQDNFDQVTGVFFFYPNTDDADPTNQFYLNVTLEGSATCYIMVSQQN